MQRFLFIFCFFSLFLGPVLAQEDQFLQANNAYNQSDYGKAISLYEEILSTQQESADLYLNLGNAYLKNNQLGKAVLNYERGLKIDNSNKLLLQNLKFANKQIETPLTLIQDFFLSRYWHTVVTSMSSGGWASLQIILLILIAIALGFWFLGKSLSNKKTAFYSLIILVSILLFSILAGTTKYNIERNATHAVVINNSASLLTGASPQSELLLNLSEGIKVKLLDQIEDYYKVELIDKEVGWIALSELEAI